MIMKQTLLNMLSVPVFIFLLFYLYPAPPEENIVTAEDEESHAVTIAGTVMSHDTLELIFNKHNLDKSDMRKIYNQSREQYDLSRIAVGSMYTFELDRTGHAIQRMQYGIDDRSYLSVVRRPNGFSAEKVNLPVSRRRGSLHINIKDNLASSMPGTHKEYLKLALDLSDIFAWDIDFSNDIRNNDSVKIIVEELWVGDVFKGYGNILAAEFINKGKAYSAYRFDHEGYVDYFDEKGRSLKKSLLRSPLKFKYISSGFSQRRFHPVLRIHRPHLGIDYAAPTGTPVSAAGSGTVLFAGYKGQNGKMVNIKHPGGYTTYYGHLARIPKSMRKGKKISQGDIIGYVGSTGLSTGPHLDYRIKSNGKFVNPLKIRLPRGKPVPESMMTRFIKVVEGYEAELKSMDGTVVAYKGEKRKSG
jgi:murein DD-endopeptidase MepM/ murein hydrolase activator NlpD